MKTFKQKIGEEAYQELENIIKQNIDIRKIASPEDFAVRKKALELLLDWLNAVYELDQKQIEHLDEADFAMSKMFKIRN
jgi:hypothetical protein